MSSFNDEEELESDGFQCMNSGNGEKGDTVFEIEVNGIPLQLQQEASNVIIGHGAVVWEASVIFAKYLEHGSDKSLLQTKCKGKTVIELGCGPGLGGLSLMLSGCAVCFTDLSSVIEAVARPNVHRAYRCLTSQGANGLELIQPNIFPLDWTDKAGISTIKKCIQTNGFDIVLMCDCVFSEFLVPDLVRNIEESCLPQSIVYCVHEIRDTDANDAFLTALSKSFTLKKVPLSKQHPNYTHPLVQIVVAKPLRTKIRKEKKAATF